MKKLLDYLLSVLALKMCNLFFYIFTIFNKNSAVYVRLEWLFVQPKKSLLIKKIASSEIICFSLNHTIDR